MLPDGKKALPVSMLQDSQLFVEQRVQANNKANIKAPHHCSFAKGIHRELVVSIHKGKHFHVVTSLWLLSIQCIISTWWRHQMETFSTLLALCAGNSSVVGDFPAERPVTRSFDIFFDMHLNKRFSKQWWGCWFNTPSCPLWRHCNELST